MKPMKTVLLTTFALLMSAVQVSADEPIVLRYQMKEDQPLVYQTKTLVNDSSTVNDQSVESVITSEDISVRSLQKIDEDGHFQIQTENKRMLIKMDIGSLGEYEFDSQSSDRDSASVLGAALTPVYGRLNGAFLTFTISPRGKVIALSGYHDLIGDVLEDNPIGVQFTGGGSDEAAAAGAAEMFVAFPENALQPGDTWESAYEIPLPNIGQLTGKRVYTFEGPDKVGDRATVKITMTHDLSADLDMEQGPATITGTMSIDDSAGTIQFDPVAGQLISMKSRYELSGNLTATMGDQTFSIAKKQKQSIKVQLLDNLPE